MVKDYEDINFMSIKDADVDYYQVKNEMMYLGKHKAYLTCNLGTRRCHTSNIECCHLTKLI